MKKLGILLSILILFGFSSVASAKTVASAKRYMWREGRQVYFRELAKKAMLGRILIDKIKMQGKEVFISYTYETGNTVVPYSRNGEVKGWEYVVWKEAQGKDVKDVYILLDNSDWEDMYKECMPNKITRAVASQSKKINHKLETTYNTYNKSGSGLFDHEHYAVDGKKYTVIKLHNVFTRE